MIHLSTAQRPATGGFSAHDSDLRIGCCPVAIYIPELSPTEVRIASLGNLQDLRARSHGRCSLHRGRFVRAHRVTGLVLFLIALLIGQIYVVIKFGVEPRRKRLEELTQYL